MEILDVALALLVHLLNLWLLVKSISFTFRILVERCGILNLFSQILGKLSLLGHLLELLKDIFDLQVVPVSQIYVAWHLLLILALHFYVTLQFFILVA